MQVPALPGAQRFIVSRGTAILVNITGAERINATAEVTEICNAQTFSGSAWLSTRDDY